MKHILLLFLLCIGTSAMAQTKLIHHKSHSGTNATFNPHTTEGNFGLPDYFSKELKKNKKSTYKLIRRDYNMGKLSVEYILYKKESTDTKNTSINGNKNDIVLAKVALSTLPNSTVTKEIEKLMLQELEKYRSEEKL